MISFFGGQVSIASFVFSTVMGFAFLFTAYKLLKIAITNKASFKINKDGILVSSKTDTKIDSRKIMNFIKELVQYIEVSKEHYVDDVIGVKNRFFKQSKDYAKSSLETVKNEIVEEYKILYMYSYDGKSHDLEAKAKKEDDSHLRKTNVPPTIIQVNNKSMMVNPCSNICNKGCNSGLNFFESRINKDFKYVLESVYKIVEENHLINRPDREYEEEILSKADQLTSYLRNIVISYPIPIDNEIAKRVLDDKSPALKEAVADSLRRSRTLSGSKREVIEKLKMEYIKNRNRQLVQLANFIDEGDLNLIIKSIDRDIKED